MGSRAAPAFAAGGTLPFFCHIESADRPVRPGTFAAADLL